MQNYQFYTDGKSKVVAIYKYGGKNIRGVAKCHPNDTFNYEVGQKIAQLKCQEKLLNKKLDDTFVKREIAKDEALRYMDELAYRAKHFNELSNELTSIRTSLLEYK